MGTFAENSETRDPAEVFDKGDFAGVDPYFQHSRPDVGLVVKDDESDDKAEEKKGDEKQKAPAAPSTPPATK